MRDTLKHYYVLTKPGIVYGNAITAAAGFFLASKGHLDLGLFAAAVAGISLVIASACVINNYIDRHIDDKMARTKNRALVSGKISVAHALIFATCLGLAGFALLMFGANLLAAFITFIGFFFYVVMYSIWKRRSVHGTIVGSISGAVPITAGYCAVTGRFDTGALLLFLILVVWQMPHFYAIAIYRQKDYAAAGIPVLPIKAGLPATKRQMLVYIVVFICLTILLAAFGYGGWIYLIVMLGVGLLWLKRCLDGFKKGTNDPLWARRLFKFSLIVLMTFSATISLNAFLP